MIFFGCSNDENTIYEISLYKDKIEFPFEEIENGNFITIFRNNHFATLPASVIMLSNEVMIDSQNLDFCEGVNALRNGKRVMEWTIINHNFPFTPEINVENQNDHPGLISYNLPKGTFMVMLMDSTDCNKDNYVIFDVKTNDGLMLNK